MKKTSVQRFHYVGLMLSVFVLWNDASHAQSVKQNLWIADSPVRAMVKSGHTIYIGGDFKYVGPMTGSGVVLNTTSGSLLATSPRVDGEVSVALPDGNNGWYIGGTFSSVNGVARFNAAHVLASGVVDAWNPSPNGRVAALALGFNRIFVGGEFNFIGGQLRNYIATVNNTTGAALAWNPGANARVNTIVPDGPSLYVGGAFTVFADSGRNGVGVVDTSTFSVAGRFNPNVNGEVFKIAIGSGTVYLGGSFSLVDGQARANLAQVDFTGNVQGWNPAPNNSVYDLEFYGAGLYVAGDFTTIVSQARNGLAKLNPVTGALFPWNPNPNAGARSLSPLGTQVYFGGSFTVVGVEPRNFLAAADTTGVGALASWNPFAGSPVNAVATQDTIAFAGGLFTSVNGIARNNLAALFDTSGVVTSFNPNVTGDRVDALALVGSTLYAGGSFTLVGTELRSNLAAINTSTGTPTSWNPSANGGVYAIGVVGSTVYAGGSFTTIGSFPRNRIAAIDATTGIPTSWNPDADSDVLALDAAGTMVYAGGVFSNIGGQARNMIAALDALSGLATAWNPDAGTSGKDQVSSLLAFGSVIYAGGQFTAIGGQQRNSVAALDATTGASTAFNAGLPSFSFVDAIARGANNLYLGGALNVGQRFAPLPSSDLASVDPVSGVANSWDPRVSGLVYDIATSDSTVYAGGSFFTVQNESRQGIVGISDTSLLHPGVFVSPVSLNYGSVIAGQAKVDSVLVKNIGGVNLNITSAASDNARFGVSPLNATILPGAGRTFFVTFSPTGAGVQTATISFTHNASGSPSTVTAAGTGLAPAFSVAPESLVYGNVVVGTTKLDSLTVTNTGSAALFITNVSSSNARFTLNRASDTLAPLASRKFFVTFSPNAAGNFVGDISFTHNAAGSPALAGVTGVGVAPVFSAAPTSIGFGNVLLTLPKTDSVTVTNTGTSTLNITNVTSSLPRFGVTPTNAILAPDTSRRFLVTFTPTALGVVNANITFTHDAAGTPTNVPVSGTGVAPAFSVVPASLAFGNVAVNLTKQDSVIVTNTGTSTLTISNVVSSLPRFSVLPANAVLIPNASARFLVSFTPNATGPFSGNIVFTHDATGSPTNVPVSGTGVAPGFSVTPVSLNFGNVILNSSKQDSLTVTNTGTLTLNISNVTSTLPRFGVTPSTATLLPNASRKFFVTFTPTTLGTVSANIGFTHDAAGSPTNIPASGTGVVPLFAVIPLQVNFNNIVINTTTVDSTVIVTNSGGAPLTIASVTSSDTQFTVAPTNAIVAAAGGTRRFFFSFRPGSVGLKSSNVIFTHNAAGSPDTVVATGTGVTSTFNVTPSNLQFGNVNVGGSKLDSILVRNTGNFVITILSATTGNQQFIVTPQSADIPIGGNREFLVRFSPTAAGTVTSSVTFVHNAVGSPTSVTVGGTGLGALFSVAPPSLAFGNVRVGTSKQDSLTVTNAGTDTLRISNITSSNTRFVVAATIVKVNPASSTKLPVTFTPDAAAPASGTITFIHNAPGSPSTVDVSGVGAVPSFALNATQVGFGSVVINSTSLDTSIVVTNSGGIPLTISAVTSSDTQFTVTPTSTTVAASGGTRRFSIRFTPRSIGLKTSNTVFTHDAAGSPTLLNLSGTGVTSGSITVTQAQVESSLTAGSTIRFFRDISSSTVNVGKTGGPNIYDFSTLPFFFFETETTFSVSQIPQLATRFPSNAVALKQSRESGGLEYPVFSFSNQRWYQEGQLSTFPPSTERYRHSVPSETQIEFPVTFNAQFATAITELETTYVNGILSQTNSRSVSRTSTVDGYGTLLLPGGLTFNCLRVRYVDAPPSSTKDFTFFTQEGAFVIITTLNTQADTGFVQSSGHFYLLRGAPVGGALFSVAPPILAFGNVRVGTSKQDSLTVTNAGTDTLRISNITSSNTRFVVAATIVKVNPASSTKLPVTFTPDAAAPASGTITFIHNAPGSPSTVDVSGTGVAPALFALPRFIVFNEIGVGSRVDTTVRLINVGTASLRVDSVRLHGRDASDFVLVGSSGPFLPTAPGDTVNATLRFAPLTVDTLKSAVLLIHSDASPAPDTVTLRGRSRSSFVQVNVTGDTTVGSRLDIGAQPPLGFTVTRAVLHYRAAGKSTYDTLTLGPSGQGFAGTFPDSIVTPRGIEYYVRLIGVEGTITNPETNPINNPLRLRVKVAVLASRLQLQARVYRMASVPLELADSRVSTQLYDDYGPYNPTRYRLFKWEPDSSRYSEYDPLEDGHISLGEAYWIITNDGHGADVQDGRSTLSDRPFSILLEPGWNQIASPFAFAVLWQSIANSSRVRPPFFFDGVGFVPNIAVVNPWEGYFVLNDSSQGITLSVPPVEASIGIPKHAQPFALIGERDYVLQISADAVAGLRDMYNYVGMMENATTGYDMIDLPDPPMIGDYVSLSIVDGGRSFAANFKPLSNEGQQWEMRISSTLPNQTVRVSFNEMDVPPPAFSVYVLDEDEFAAVSLAERSFSVQLGTARTVRSFRVIVGTTAYAEHASAGIPLTPVEYSLEQNYPNPFNPSTTIRYSLNKRSNVVLEIYNTLGQKVKSLVSREQTTGMYSIVWDGSSDAGGTVSSGVYFYRLRAGDFLSSKKLLLLR